MNQLTIRGMSPELQKVLHERSRDDGVSLNRTVVSLLQQAAGLRPEGTKRRDLAGIAGSWTAADAAEFDCNTQVFERVDDEIWR